MTEIGSFDFSEEEPIMNFEMLRGFSLGDVEVEKELIQVFVEQSDINLESLDRTKNEEGSVEWHESAHMFKGGAAGIGAAPLAMLCAEAQHFKGTAAEQSALFGKIAQAYDKVKNLLRTEGLLA